ncbi:MAG: Helix-turn-helix domain protein [Pelotomaculum sp. PtaU1.Bin065]|nr:MAG: Helix-turn-helix domain protein [Pelotomaculum sp. PtaU1.Bin065]
MENTARVKNVPDVAKILNVSKSFMYKLVKSGQVPSIRLGDGRRVVIPVSAIEDLLTKWKSS